MLNIENIFAQAVSLDASDVYLVAGSPVTFRIGGELSPQEEEHVLKGAEIRTAILGILSPEQKTRLEKELDLDFGLPVGENRFRLNVHYAEGELALAARLVPAQIPTPEALNFEPALFEFANLLDGLVLVVGPTGNGKSTTLASMVELINSSRKSHIITIEDPVEFLFKEKMSIIEQREVGSDTTSFASALKHVLRQDPNVILVGEMRDPETISTVLTAAETGHLVFSTLHTGSAAEAVERIVDVFDGAKQRQILTQLSGVLRGVVAQQLVPKVGGGRVAAREILINTTGVANLIKENNIAQIKSALQTGAKDGMVTMEQSLKKLLDSGLIDEEVAARRGGHHRLL